jgi:acetyl-CoA carboxylase carboxyltransferase component
MKEVEERVERDMDPARAAAQMDVDEIVLPSELRLWLEAAVSMAYQSIGYRRVKNPRIWSLHDLRALTSGEAG